MYAIRSYYVEADERSKDIREKYVAHLKAMHALLGQSEAEAAREIPRQLRLRDLGGLVVIDFIDMESAV